MYTGMMTQIHTHHNDWPYYQANHITELSTRESGCRRMHVSTQQQLNLPENQSYFSIKRIKTQAQMRISTHINIKLASICLSFFSKYIFVVFWYVHAYITQTEFISSMEDRNR